MFFPYKLRPEDSSLASGKREGVEVYFFATPFLHLIFLGLFVLSQCLGAHGHLLVDTY